MEIYKPEIHKLLKHLTNQLIEKQVYFVVPAIDDETIRFEVMWKKKDKLPWSFTLYQADNWTPCSQLDILDALEEVECDLMLFSKQIVDKMLTQVAYMSMRINDVRELLGDETVDASIVAHEEFGKALCEAVNKLLSHKEPKELSLVED